MNTDQQFSAEQGRRSFFKTALYVAPAIVTLNVTPAFASYGSSAPQQPANGTDGLAALFAEWLK